MATRRSTSNSRQPARPAGSAETDPDEGLGSEGSQGAVYQLEAAIEPVARAMGFEVVHLEWAGGRGSRVARVYLDHPRGVSLDDCTRMSGVLSNALDAAEADWVAAEEALAEVA